MGKALIIKGADFSNSYFDTLTTGIGILEFSTKEPGALNSEGGITPATSGSGVHIVTYNVIQPGKVYIKGRAGTNQSSVISALCGAYDSNGLISGTLVTYSDAMQNYKNVEFVIPQGATSIKVNGNDSYEPAGASSTPFPSA